MDYHQGGRSRHRLLKIFHINLASFFLALALPLVVRMGDSLEATHIPLLLLGNLTRQPSSNLSLGDVSNYSGITSHHGNNVTNRHSDLLTRRHGDEDNRVVGTVGSENRKKPRARSVRVPPTRTLMSGVGVKREFPTALVVASSVVAICIVLFFLLSYYWHTRQLDSRARKLAIRLAADSEHAMRVANNSNTTTATMSTITTNNNASHSSTTTRPKLMGRGAYARAVTLSESSQEANNGFEALPTTDDDPPLTNTGSDDGGVSSVVVSESETAADLDDIFDESEQPLPLPRGARSGSSHSRGLHAHAHAHRKWSRSLRKSSGPANLDSRWDSAVTDKEILTHFANRRHSTFFI